MKPGLAKTLAVVLLAVVLLLVNFLAARLPLRGDLTAGRIFTLSPGTRALLGKIEEPITLQLYSSRGVAGLPTSYKNYADRVEEMLRAYVRASGGRLTLEVVSPAPDSPEEERAQAADLQPQQVPLTGEPYYLGLVALQADQQKIVPTLSPQREELLEYDISSLLHAVQQLNKPRLGLLTKLPLAGEPFNMMNQRGRPAQLIHQEWSRSFEIVAIEPGFTELPADLAALAVLHPAGLTPAQEFALDQFILSGKPVLLAVDPSSTWFKRQGGQAGMFGMGSPDASSNLSRLLPAYGIGYDAQQVVGDSRLATPVNAGNGQIARMPVWLSLTADQLNPASPATAQLGSLLFIETGALDIAPREGREITRLVETSEVAGLLPNFTLQFAQPDDIARSLTPGTGKKTLAALVRGPLATAFPEGKPTTSAKKEEATTAEATPSEASAKEGNATILVIADTDWLLDDFSVRRIPAFGQEMIEPLNDNLFFASNAVEFLAGSPDLIALRGKTSAQRPFEVVQLMEIEAQQRYTAQLAALETPLAEVQGKLSQLQSRSGDSGRLVATPEVLAEIEKFQADELSMRRERRDIRRALREDIDALETRLLVLNLLATPVLLGVFGLWFARHRKRAA
jgi:ABC-type uncharacterized transport system involved in gliding motility auxiliary subunit